MSDVTEGLKTLGTVLRAVRAASRAQKAAPLSAGQEALAKSARDKFAKAGIDIDATIDRAVKKALATNKARPAKAPQAAASLEFHTAHNHRAVAKQAAMVNPSSPGAISATIKAITQNKLGVDSTDGRTIRNDRSTSPEFTDAAATNVRRPIAFDVQEAVCDLTARKSRRDPTAEEIRAETGAPARDADSILAIMRANRKLR